MVESDWFSTIGMGDYQDAYPPGIAITLAARERVNNRTKAIAYEITKPYPGWIQALTLILIFVALIYAADEAQNRITKFLEVRTAIHSR